MSHRLSLHVIVLFVVVAAAGLVSGSSLAARAQTAGDICRYDVVPDGVINAADTQAVAAAFRTPAYDFDGDGTTDLDDVMAVGSAWGQQCVYTPVSTTELRQEAEAAAEVVGPMIRVTGNPDASACGYVETPLGGPAEGYVRFGVQIPSSGTYYVWGRYRAQGSSADSFRIQVDSGPLQIWRLGQQPWLWRPAESSPYGTAYTYQLTAGLHTITISTYEAGAALDAIEVTSNPFASPSWKNGCSSGNPTPTATPGPIATAGRLNVDNQYSFWGDWAMQVGYYWCEDPDTRTNCKPPSYIYDQAIATGYDFMSLADDTINMSPAMWQDLATAADTATNQHPGTFVGVRGYEYTGNSPYYNTEGHLMTWGLANYPIDLRSALRDYYPWLAAQPPSVIAAFNHPSRLGDVDWELSDFEYHPEVDERVELTQLNPAGTSGGVLSTPLERILSAGWHVGAGGWSPQRNQLIPGNRVYGVMMSHLTRNDLLAALKARRTFALDPTREGALALVFRAEGGSWMGSSVEAGSTFDFEVRWNDNKNRPLARLELVGADACNAATGAVLRSQNTSGASGVWSGSVTNSSPWYFVRAYDSNNVLVGWTSPIWSHRQFATVAGASTLPAATWARIESSNPGTRFSDWISFKGDGSNAVLMRFSVPSGVQVKTALLKLTTAARSNTTDDMNIGLYPLSRSWNASEVSWLNATSSQTWA
ncbi:MAG TPA: hypothetical protein DEP84_06125, partial [Chloroflexi bacterium]|nr:hypothetical protein [Chloroflexota bacterium]